MNSPPAEQHNLEIQENLEWWHKKPLLRRVYHDAYRLISERLSAEENGLTVEVGSGIGNVKDIIPDCVRTDLFDNPWIDQVENIYRLSFPDGRVGNLILFDVFHHLEYPALALQECYRVLCRKGRVLVFDPYVSLLGLLVYGLFHHEPLGAFTTIREKPTGDGLPEGRYFAAIAHTTRIFFSRRYAHWLEPWNVLSRKRFAAISYIASGGYRGPQLYPDSALPLMRVLDKVCDLAPPLFATRLLVVLEKP